MNLFRSTPKVSAFIRTYKGDIEWLKYCLQSLEKRGKEFCEIVVAYPADESENFFALAAEHKGIAFIPVPEHNPIGYQSQQITKSCADLYCKGDFIMHFDSDCVALRAIEVAEFFDGDKPKLLFRKWEDAGGAQAWHYVTSGVLRINPSFEFMPSMPIIYHRSTHELFRNYIAHVHGIDFLEWSKNVKQFSEFNAIGNFAHLFTPDAYSFVRAFGEGDGYPRPFKQFWSRGAIPHEEIEGLLK